MYCTLTRKTLLTKSKVEYADYTINHVLGCAHGCQYPCYAYLMKKRFGEVKDFDDWREPRLVSNALDILDDEIPKLKSKIKSVHLCFSTDPFMYMYDAVAEMSLAIIRKLNDAGIKCTVLTKGVLPVELAELSRENEYGITLVSLDTAFKGEYEPRAAPTWERVLALKRLSDRGCKTWVSIEPYPTPNIICQSLQDILEAVFFTDKIIFGRWNYNRRVNNYPDANNFYNQAAAQVKAHCDDYGIQCIIKKGTISKE